MSKTTEIEFKFDGGRVLSSEVKDGICRMVVEIEDGYDEDFLMLKEINKIPTEKKSCDPFVLIPASKLSLTDDFMRHTPKTEREEALRKELVEVIRKRVPDFYRPRFDPSFDREGNICYQAGFKPVEGKNFDWWEKQAKAFCPECKSRLGTKAEYVAFLGVLLKELVVSGWNIDDAWNAVCNDSRKLGHYRNSDKAQNDFELTGSREVWGYFDLANTYKVLAEDEEADGFWLAGGAYCSGGSCYPLASIYRVAFRNLDLAFGVGWLVLEA